MINKLIIFKICMLGIFLHVNLVMSCMPVIVRSSVREAMVALPYAVVSYFEMIFQRVAAVWACFVSNRMFFVRILCHFYVKIVLFYVIVHVMSMSWSMSCFMS